MAGTIIFDLDGVVYLGSEGIDGAGDVLAELQRAGWTLLYATNNASATPTSVRDKISALTGFVPDPESVVTCAMAAARYLEDRAASCFVVGEPGLRDTLAHAGFDIVADASGADAVVVGVDFGFTYATLDAASRAIRAGALFVATNTDANYPTPSGLAPGAGAIVASVATAAGADPIVVGKPEQPMVALLTERVGSSEVWVVGDRPETDIAMAHIAGWRSILPLTGVVAEEDQLLGRPLPDHVVASITEVPRVVGALPA